MAETDFTVTPVLPETEYLVWASRKRGGDWGPWSLPQTVTTAAATHAPDPPAVPILGTALGCHEIAVRVPALAVHGCAAARNVEVELRQAGGADSDWHEVDGVMGEDEATLTVKRLDPARTYEFRSVAHNRHGSTPGNSTGKVSVAVAPLGALSAPHVAGTSSQTISVDWSHLSTGCAVPPWTVSFRRAGGSAEADGWVALERGYRRTSMSALLACPSGCAFRVTPELPGWDQPSAQSQPVRTPVLAPPQAGAVRLLVRFRPAAAELGDSAPGGVARAFETEVQEALHLPQGRVRVAETRRAQGALYAALDILPPPHGDGPAIASVASGLRAQLLDETSPLRSSEIGYHLVASADVTRLQYDSNNDEVFSSLEMPEDAPLAQPTGGGAVMLAALALVAAAAGCGLYRASGRGLRSGYTGLRAGKESPRPPSGDPPESVHF